ncbi:unnamed protein product, partial [marine sediment metagenome]
AFGIRVVIVIGYLFQYDGVMLAEVFSPFQSLPVELPAIEL